MTVMARLAGSISSPRHSSTARSTVCSSSRTLPGQGYCIICCMADGRKAAHLLAIAGAAAAEKVRGQQRNVFAPIAQRGQMDLHRVEAEEQVFAEVARRGLFVQLGIGGGENAHVDAPRLRRADPLQFAGLEHAQQLGLLAHGDVGDLVEKQRAAVGQFEAADAVGARVGECAFDVAEDFALEGALGQARRR